MDKIIEFHAEWCGPCKQLSPIMAEIESEFGNFINFEVKNIDVDVDDAYEYGIYSIPTLVFEKNGVEVGRVSGFHTKEVLEEKIKAIYA